MPATTEAPVKAYAHCVNSRCRGNQQEPIEAILVEESWFYPEVGGDGMFGHPERTSRRLRFADLEESKCSHCGANRDLSETPRLQLDDSGYDRMALLDIEPDLRNPESYTKGGGGHIVIDDRSANLEAENNDLRERLAKLEGFMLGKQSSEPEVVQGHNGDDLTSPLDGQSEVHFVEGDSVPPEEDPEA